MGDEREVRVSVDLLHAGEDDVFHDRDGRPVIGDADPFEVALFAHQCWRLGIDAEATAVALGVR
jgi:hypothetical protein